MRFVQMGQRIQIATHTNIAVDNAALKLAEFADGLPALAEGRIVRFGPPQLAAVRTHPQILPHSAANAFNSNSMGAKQRFRRDARRRLHNLKRSMRRLMGRRNTGRGRAGARNEPD